MEERLLGSTGSQRPHWSSMLWRCLSFSGWMACACNWYLTQRTVQLASLEPVMLLDDDVPTRLPGMSPTSLTVQQKSLYDEIVASAKDSKGRPLKTRVDAATGHLTGPFNAMLLNPVLGKDFVTHLAHLRFNATLPHVAETVILFVAYSYKADYIFCVHSHLAQVAGLTAPAIEALREGKASDELPADSAAAMAVVQQVLTGTGFQAVSDAVYNEAIRHLGQQGVFEVVSTAGFYVTLSQLLNVFRVGCPAGSSNPFST
eukprot:TRINITY_DN93464_c0_g1_i1.p1 TRINITY_DN93464_c0_g1~~TRINITY_DN93464_c0_g1_i1.p1  ORF type:complete len:259 (+),score=31.70 TRINITY_DN93464_c0_g1_i1:69-845(+)